MNYYINFGVVRNVDMDRTNKLLADHTSDKGIGLDKFFDFGFQKLKDRNTSDDKRNRIINDYFAISDDIFRNSEFREESWVTEKRLNRNKGYSSRNINTKFIDEFKKIRGGREFFRAIKDEYSDNSTHPNIEVCLINTTPFKNSLKLLSQEVLNNNEELTVEQIDFIKWAFWWGTQSLKKKGNRASVTFAKN
jgi:hypothetical protein